MVQITGKIWFVLHKIMLLKKPHCICFIYANYCPYFFSIFLLWSSEQKSSAPAVGVVRKRKRVKAKFQRSGGWLQSCGLNRDVSRRRSSSEDDMSAGLQIGRVGVCGQLMNLCPKQASGQWKRQELCFLYMYDFKVVSLLSNVTAAVDHILPLNSLKMGRFCTYQSRKILMKHNSDLPLVVISLLIQIEQFKDKERSNIMLFCG